MVIFSTRRICLTTQTESYKLYNAIHWINMASKGHIYTMLRTLLKMKQNNLYLYNWQNVESNQYSKTQLYIFRWIAKVDMYTKWHQYDESMKGNFISCSRNRTFSSRLCTLNTSGQSSRFKLHLTTDHPSGSCDDLIANSDLDCVNSDSDGVVSYVIQNYVHKRIVGTCVLHKMHTSNYKLNTFIDIYKSQLYVPYMDPSLLQTQFNTHSMRRHRILHTTLQTS